MDEKTIVLIMSALGVLCFSLMLFDLLRFFKAPVRASLRVAIGGAFVLGVADLIAAGLFALSQSIYLRVITGSLVGSLMGMQVCIILLYSETVLKNNKREIVVAMVDFSGGCVWLFGGVLGAVAGALLGMASRQGGTSLGAIVAVVIGLVIGVLFGGLLSSIWVYLFRSPAWLTNWSKALK